MAFPNVIYGSYGDEKVESSSQKRPLGTQMVFQDGRRYRYTENGGSAITEGLLVASEAPAGNHDEDLAVATTAAAATSVTVTLGNTAAAKNLYKDGYLFINAPALTSSASPHEFYKIKEHPQADGSATLALTLDERAGLHTAITNGTEKAGLIKNPWKDVVVAPAVVTGRIVGLTVNHFTADYFGWVQVSGIAVAAIDGTPSIGQPLGVSSTHTGQFLVVGADTTATLAKVHGKTTVNDEYHTVMLTGID